MNREVIEDQIRELIPEIRRRECTPRVMAPVDFLLDQLLELDKQEHHQSIAIMLSQQTTPQ